MDYAAHAHMKSCEVFNALPYRERAVEYARKAVELDPEIVTIKRILPTHFLHLLKCIYDTRSKCRRAIDLYLEATTYKALLLTAIQK